jgi:hypothetical protein
MNIENPNANYVDDAAVKKNSSYGKGNGHAHHGLCHTLRDGQSIS